MFCVFVVLLYLAETTMPNPHLPAEVLDLIVDLLETESALRSCCLVSGSWIPRTRKHLFADISFVTERHLQSWKKMFPDPSTSPAYYTKALFVCCSHAVTVADTEASGWIRGFSRVAHLEVGPRGLGGLLAHRRLATDLFPFHGLSLVIKSLHVNYLALPPSQILDLPLSFPLLEDLTVVTYRWPKTNSPGGLSTAARPSSLPRLTGSLLLKDGMRYIARQLLSLPSGIHFRKVTLTWNYDDDPLSAMALVEGCSHTLEFLKITCHRFRAPVRHLCPHQQLTCF